MCIIPNNPFCRADGLMGNAHNASDVADSQPHLVEDEEKGVVGGLGNL